MKKQKQKAFGRDWTNGEIAFPEHLTPEIIHASLWIHNAKDDDEGKGRCNYLYKELGYKKMAFVRARVMLPWLMEQMRDTDSFKQHMKARERKLN